MTLLFRSSCEVHNSAEAGALELSVFLFFFSLLAIRKHYTIASYKLMCWQLGQ